MSERAINTVVNGMDAEMRPLSRDTVIFRGRRDVVNHERGELLPDDAIQSWTMSWDTAKDFAGGSFGRDGTGTVYVLRAPKGTKAVVENPKEKEVTIKAGTQSRIIKRLDDPVARPERKKIGFVVYLAEIVD